MGTAETRRAIDTANAAWPAWRATTAKQRAVILRHWHDLMMENADDLAKILTTEQGKPLAEAKGEIQYAASFIEWFAEEGKRVNGDTHPDAGQRQAHRRDERADRRLRRHHAVELPGRDDHPQGRSGARGGLPDRRQTG